MCCCGALQVLEVAGVWPLQRRSSDNGRNPSGLVYFRCICVAWLCRTRFSFLLFPSALHCFFTLASSLLYDGLVDMGCECLPWPRVHPSPYFIRPSQKQGRKRSRGASACPGLMPSLPFTYSSSTGAVGTCGHEVRVLALASCPRFFIRPS